MEEVSNENEGKKRARPNSDVDSPELQRVDPDDSAAKRVRTDPDLDSADFNPVEIPDDILDILDEADSVSDCDPAIEDLDSFIRSFEEEILPHPSPAPATLFPATSLEHGESQPELGFLLEASDDELGLPPTVSPSGEEPTTKAESADLATFTPGEILGFEGELRSNDSFGFGLGLGEEAQGNNSEFVTVGGLFDFDSADFSEFLYRAESLHAV